MERTTAAPIEWLEGLKQKPEGYRALLEEAGSLSAAAWRLARARCQAWHRPTNVPSSTEVRAAAQELAGRLRLAQRVPPSNMLASECESMGLLVL
ncbi:MAG: hypothetical protein ACODAU_12815 [Myxococcota bacterium]